MRHGLVIRLIDVTGAFFGGIILLPVVLVVGLLIRAGSAGPALFRQQRVGRHLKPFICYKLRTMSENTPAVGTHEVSDSAVTSLGRSLRKLKLDELPQLWNVLRGDMSLVGPRPCLPSQRELIAARQSRGVYAVRPGVTGPAQVKGIDMSMPVRLAEEDATWAGEPSLRKYVHYILLTLVGKGQGDRVSAR